MKAVDTQTTLPRPGLIAALKAGFETVANHLSLVLFPIALDIVIWLGPHFRLKKLITEISNSMTQSIVQGVPDTSQAVQFSKEFWDFAAEHFNLLTVLRSFPVGIPSLMSGRSPLEIPVGSPSFVEISSWGSATLLWMFLTLIGLVLGTFYYNVVAQAALVGKVDWLSVIRNWPWSAFQVLSLALVWVLLFVAISIPSGCMIFILVASNLPFGQIVLFLYFGFLLWFFLPLFFSAHGIIVYHLGIKHSILRSIQITRMSLPITGLFFLLVILITQGLDIVWNWPAENSWFTLVGVGGHALVTSALLAASFVYYKETDQWLQKRLGLVS